MEEQPMNETMLRTILKNEITWLMFLIGAIMGFVYNVIIPLNSMNIAISQIQQDITNIKSYDARITQNANDIILLKQEVSQLQRSK